LKDRLGARLKIGESVLAISKGFTRARLAED